MPRRVAVEEFAWFREESCFPVPCIVARVCSGLLIGVFMKSAFAVAMLLMFALVNNPTNVWGADVVSDSQQVKRQAALTPSLRQAAAGAGGYDSSSIKVKSTAHQVTIEVTNGKLNSASAADRNAEASAIASAIGKAIGGKSEFAAVVTVHIDYVHGSGSTEKIVQALVFNKSSDGTFKPHQS
jgi:hypothetical protein